MKTKQKVKSRCLHPICSACRLPLDSHLGLAGTCSKLADARSALKVIHTWASFQDGRALQCKDVINLVNRVLEDTKPNSNFTQPSCDKQ
jgi:hypothetical protein